MILIDVAKDLKENKGYEDVPEKDIADLLRESYKSITDVLIGAGVGSALKIPGFGSFQLKYVPPRVARNPRTGEKVDVAEKAILKFKPSSILRGRLATEVKVSKEEKKALIKKKASVKKKKAKKVKASKKKK